MLQNLQAGLCRALMQFVVQIAFAPVRLSPAVAMVMLSPPPVPPLVVRRRLAATTCSRRQKKHALVDCSPCSKHRKAHQGSFDAFHRAMLKGKCAQTLTNTLTKKRGRNIKSLHGPRTVATHTHTSTWMQANAPHLVDGSREDLLSQQGHDDPLARVGEHLTRTRDILT